MDEWIDRQYERDFLYLNIQSLFKDKELYLCLLCICLIFVWCFPFDRFFTLTKGNLKLDLTYFCWFKTRMIGSDIKRLFIFIKEINIVANFTINFNDSGSSTGNPHPAQWWRIIPEQFTPNRMNNCC